MVVPLQETRFSRVQLPKDREEFIPISCLTGQRLISQLTTFNIQQTHQFLSYQHAVVAVRGEEARKTFYNSRSLNFTEGYKIFRGGVRQHRQLWDPPIGISLPTVFLIRFRSLRISILTRKMKIAPGLSNTFSSFYTRTGCQMVSISYIHDLLSSPVHTRTTLQAIPVLFEDVNNRMMTWGKNGQIDPFKDINDVR